ncbi:hypothetical protein QQF64_003140 [Cirrhinus molitorella]|uniref:Uncharacterized protein n=1 Tax=Cirrhinus molitorella TaxID=172907 RepID=A0ABR3MKY1_9TELE
MDGLASALNKCSFHLLKPLCVGVVVVWAVTKLSALMMGRYKTDPQAGSAPLILLQPDACLLHGSPCFCSDKQGGKAGHRVFRAEESTFSSLLFMSKEDSTASGRTALVANPAGPQHDPLRESCQPGQGDGHLPNRSVLSQSVEVARPHV